MVDLTKAECIFVTGGCGFIGSEFVNQVLEKYPNLRVINIDALTYAADQDRILANPRHELVVERVENVHMMKILVETYSPAAIVHFAAESHVDRSNENSLVFVDSNVKGTASLLEAIKGTDTTLLYVSTDEVYGEAPEDREFLETDELNPGNPYSASKAGAELLVRAHGRTFGTRFIITRGANTYGVGQHREKLIPMVLGLLLSGRPGRLYGDGRFWREWLHVSDHAAGILAALTTAAGGSESPIFNLGSGTRASNIELVTQMGRYLSKLGLWDGDGPFFVFTEDRPGHDSRYALNSSKAKEALGWTPVVQGSPLSEEALHEMIQAVLAEEPGIIAR